MIIVSYDIKNDRLRTRFSKFLLRFGCRIQFSVYRIENSPRVLDNIVASVQTTFLPQFSEEDSVLIPQPVLVLRDHQDGVHRARG